MYFAATRSLVNRQIKPWTLQLQFNIASKPHPSKCAFQPIISGFHHENLYVVPTTRIGSLQLLPKPYLCSPSSATTSMSMASVCGSYFVTPGCRPTDRAYFTRKEDDDDMEKKIKEIIGENKAKTDENLNAYSLETLRRKIKSENLQDPDVPPGWKKRK